jgi:hypothetical protein
MKSLLSAIEDTRTRYIRCIKPNNNTENDVKKEMEQTTSPAVQENYLENSLCEGTMGSLATGDDEVFVVSHLIIEQSVVEQSVSNIAEEVCGEKVEERYLQAQMEENAVRKTHESLPRRSAGFDTKIIRMSSSFSEMRLSQGTQFSVKHFACEVVYSADKFLEQNMDKLSDDLIKCATKTSNSLVRAELNFRPCFRRV